MAKKRVARERAAAATKEVHLLRDYDQVRAIADPLRVRILEALCHEERTTKQVAEHLGERPTRLYHHVDILVKAGLLELARTQPKRGTVEKYYRAVAHAFRADPSLFASASPEASASLQAVVTTMFDSTSAELGAIIRAGHGEESIEREGVLAFVELHASEPEILELRGKLQAWLEELPAHSIPSADPERRYRVTIAMYPIDRRG